jgi:hypothetical protein
LTDLFSQKFSAEFEIHETVTKTIPRVENCLQTVRGSDARHQHQCWWWERDIAVFLDCPISHVRAQKGMPGANDRPKSPDFAAPIAREGEAWAMIVHY